MACAWPGSGKATQADNSWKVMNEKNMYDDSVTLEKKKWQKKYKLVCDSLIKKEVKQNWRSNNCPRELNAGRSKEPAEVVVIEREI